MRVTILALGTRGDVQPYVALGKGLLAAGNDVTFATFPGFMELASAHGLEARPLGSDPFGRLATEKGRAFWTSRRPDRVFQQKFHILVDDEVLQIACDCAAACEDADAIVSSMTSYYFGHTLAVYRDVPLVFAPHLPAAPTGDWPAWHFPPLPFGHPRARRAYNLVTHAITLQVGWRNIRSRVNRWRARDLGLPPVPPAGPYRQMLDSRVPILHGYCAEIVPRPVDWPEWYHVTGFWFLEHGEDQAASHALQKFLAAGPTPIFIGFGTQSDPRLPNPVGCIVEALRISGRRAVFVARREKVAGVELPDTIFHTEYVPLEWLLPRVTAAVHHAGAGTSALALRAGIPSVTVPYAADQPFWARRLHELGVGTEPIARKKLNAGALAGAIERAVTDDAMRRAAVLIGERVTREDGVGRAVEIFGREVARWSGWRA